MNKYFKIIFIILIIVGAYLYLAHWYIYHKIRSAGLKEVNTLHGYVINNSPAEGNLVYAALGDSLTAGVGTERYNEAYPYLLAEKIAGGKKIVLKGFAYPGAKTKDLIKDLLEPAVASQPDIITLMIGTNDAHGNVSQQEFANNYEYILQRLTQGTKAKVYAISIPFIGAKTLVLPPWNYYYDRKISKFNQIIKDLATRYNVKYIDLATPTQATFKQSGPYYATDLFHPSAEGYGIWAKVIYADLNQ